jgi:hypothetical protein
MEQFFTTLENHPTTAIFLFCMFLVLIEAIKEDKG